MGLCGAAAPQAAAAVKVAGELLQLCDCTAARFCFWGGGALAWRAAALQQKALRTVDSTAKRKAAEAPVHLSCTETPKNDPLCGCDFCLTMPPPLSKKGPRWRIQTNMQPLGSGATSQHKDLQSLENYEFKRLIVRFSFCSTCVALMIEFCTQHC